MKEFKAYHKGTSVVKFKRVEFSNGFLAEYTYDEDGNKLTFKDSDGFSSKYTYDENGNELTFESSYGEYRIKGNPVTK